MTRPKLRPEDPSGEQAFLRTIEKSRSQLANICVNTDLPDQREIQLSALVCDFAVLHERYRSHQKTLSLVRESAEFIGKRKLLKVRKLAGELRSLGSSLPLEHPLASGKILSDSLKLLDSVAREWTFPTKAEVKEYEEFCRAHFPQTEDPTPWVTWQLYQFFVLKCHLAKREAEVRVAKIENSFFGGNIRYIERYDSGDLAKGSTTIRRRIDRYSKNLKRKRPKVADCHR